MDAELTTRSALSIGKLAGKVSRLWGQRGLGTLFVQLRRLPVIGGARCRVEFMPGAWFETEVFEPCWGPVVVGGRPYERDVMAVVRRFAPLKPAFIDGGANYGYWSIVASALGYSNVVAIEANPATFRRLRDNAKLNGDGFRCVNRALLDRSGKWVTLVDAEHHVVSHVSEAGDSAGVAVESVSIDDAIEACGFDDTRFVIKLDVENSEVKAIEGAQRLRERAEHVFVFEDWASFGYPTIASLKALGYVVFHVDSFQRCREVVDLEHAAQLVVRDATRNHGKNFVGVPAHGAFFSSLRSWASESR